MTSSSGYTYISAKLSELTKRTCGDTPPAILVNQTKTGQSAAYWSKTSVDTDGFVPGRYRVNPYNVESRDWEGSTDVVNFYVVAYYNTCKYETWLDGTRYHAFLSDVINKYPKPSATWEDDLAKQRAHSNVDGALLDLGVELGELRETLQFLRHPFLDLRTYLSQKKWQSLKRDLLQYLRTGKFRGRSSRAAADAAARAWLEFRFGLMPLLTTIGEVLKLAQGKLKDIDPEKIYSARGLAPLHEKDLIKRPLEQMLVGFASYLSCRVEVTVRQSIMASASVQYQYKDLPSLSHRLGLDWTYLPEVAWELTRLSFVVDRFLGIGPWLSSLRCQPYITKLGGTVGVKKVTEARITGIHLKHYYGSEYSEPVPGDIFVRRNVYTRVVDSSMSLLPQLTLGAYVDFSQTIDHLALLFQNIRF